VINSNFAVLFSGLISTYLYTQADSMATQRKPEEVTLLIKRVQDRHHQAMDATLAPLGVTLVQWNALREINRHPGESSHALAQLTFNSDQSFGALVKRLEKLGWVVRKKGPGRAIRHQLTETGEKMFIAGRALANELSPRALKPLKPAERDLLGDLLTRLLEAPALVPDSD